MKDTLVTILNWNNTEATLRCLRGIQEVPTGLRPEILLIDNKSDDFDELEKQIKQSFSALAITLIHNQKNLGFSGGHNIGYEYAKNNGYRYEILLNNDVLITDTQLFRKLVDELQSNSSVIVAPTIYDSLKKDSIWYGGGKANRLLGTVGHERIGESKPPIGSRIVSFATGCCMAIDLQKLAKDELFDDSYFLYWEDADLCASIEKMGGTISYVPEAEVVHIVSSSLGLRSPNYAYYNIRNNFFYVRKWCEWYAKPIAYSHILYVSLKYAVIAVLRTKQKAKSLRYICKAMIDGIIRHGGPLN